jgi:hypothetical protein
MVPLDHDINCPLGKRAKNNINIQKLHDDKIKEFVPVIVNWETNYSTTTSIG